MLVEDIKFDVSLIRGPLPTIVGSGASIHTRSAGLHLSDIYKDIEDTLAPREPMDEQQLNTYRSFGFVWEQVLAQGMIHSMQNERFVRPGEFILDGIVGSPDLIDIQNWQVVDSKCTWKSSRKLDSLEKFFWVWLVQLKGYCKMIGATEAQLWVFFVNGDWKPPVPKAVAKKITFSQHEIEENWSMIKNHAKKRGWL